MSTDNQTHLLDDLQRLLEKQIELAQEGNISGVELLARQANSLAQKIARTGILELPELKDRREQLQELYDSLGLTIMAHRADISEKLSRIRKGKKTIGVYRTNT